MTMYDAYIGDIDDFDFDGDWEGNCPGRLSPYFPPTSGDDVFRRVCALNSVQTDWGTHVVVVTLLIAKLDRLARNVHFISGLMESGVDFVAADNPHANKLMIHMLAAFAEHEREQISQRTKEALAAAKARGVELGKNGKMLARQNRKKAVAFANSMAKTVQQLRNDGFTTIRQLVEELNFREIQSANGARWHIPTVHRLLRRLGRNVA